MLNLRLSLLFVLISASGLFAQSSEKPALVSLVTKDSVYVKWIPRNFDMFKSILENGVEVSYSFGSSEDFGSLSLTIIQPINQRWNSWNLANQSDDKIKTLLEGILSAGATDTSARNYAFALASIEASISEQMNLKSGLMLGFKKGNGNYLNIRVAIKGFAAEQVSVDLRKESKPTALPLLTGTLDKKRTATIFWDAAGANTSYLGFIIERKSDGGKYVQMTTEPYVHLVTSSEKKDKLAQFRDDKVEQGKKYTYRVIGLNYFGRLGATSNEVELVLPKLVNAFVNIDTIAAKGKNRMLTVHLSPEEKGKPVNAVKLQVFKSRELLEGYSMMLEQKISGFDSLFKINIPSELETGDANYYRVLVFSQDNDTVSSAPKYFFTLDQEPPKAAMNVVGKIDSLGIVTLTWEQNSDQDLQGFRVFRANTNREEFVERNTDFIKTKQFLDTLPLNTLTNEVYYFVVAVDENFNNSPSSDTVLILKPDTIAPVAPLFVDLISRQAKVVISWENSSSEDVSYQALFRTSNGKTDTLLVNKALSSKYFLDTTMTFGKETLYQMFARDRAGNTSFSKVRSVTVEPGYRNALSIVTATVNRDQKNITLKWQQPEEPVFQYFIYRKKNDGKFELIKTIEGTNLSYVDNQLTISSKYEYYVQYETKSGFRSLKHSPIPVKY